MSPAEEQRPASVTVQRRIDWADTDASGWWHNTAGFRFIEAAETTLLERLGILEDVYGRLPRVRIAADFKRGLRFRDVVECAIAVRVVGTSSVTYDFEISSNDGVSMRAEVVVTLTDEAGRPTEWPERYRALLLTAGPQPPETLSVG
jgi:YbgC/YbaW family acyl-CoA thioester hydrolase